MSPKMFRYQVIAVGVVLFSIPPRATGQLADSRSHTLPGRDAIRIRGVIEYDNRDLRGK